MRLLDTKACIFVMRHKAPELAGRIAVVWPGEFVTSAVVVAELHYGIARSAYPLRTEAETQALIAKVRVLPFDSDCAKHYGSIRAHLAAAGQQIGGNDLLIAATALAHGATVVTRNEGESRRVPGLLVEAF